MYEAPLVRMHMQVVDSLYCEALLLMDEARAYFDAASENPAPNMTPANRIALSCESLKTTTRLMTVVAWLIALRSAGAEPATVAAHRLGSAIPAADESCRSFPDGARILIAASEELYRRADRLQLMLLNAADRPDSPVHSLVARLETAICAQRAA